MTRWWKGVALLAAWLALGAPGRAQQGPYLPSPVGAARMPEPLPCGPVPPQPFLVPGPIHPYAAPPGPPSCLDLPADHSSAFQCEEFAPECACYGAIGMQWLQRGRVGKGALAVLDPSNVDVGYQPTSTHIPVQTYNDIHPEMNSGIRGTIGYLMNDQSIELTAFHVFQTTSTVLTDNPGRIDAFFYNAPLGFEGNNGLWLQADRLFTRLSTMLTSSELNYRRWNSGILGADLILGVRYVRFRESLRIFTDDEGLTFVDANGQPDPTRQADYGVVCTNNIIAPQIGFEYTAPLFPLFREHFGWVWFGLSGKAAAGVNVINTNITLSRGDGFPGLNSRYTTTQFGQVYDIGGFLDFHILERMRFRAGYNAIWLAGVANPNDQIDFNLANANGTRNFRGSTLFQGPMFELQFLW